MLIYFLKVLVVFTLSIVLIRIMGKATLSQVTPHDLMAIVFIVSIGIQPILTEDWKKALGGMILVTIIHLTVGRLSLFKRFNQMIIGQPTILIKHGKIIKENMKQSRYSLVELLSTLRAAGYPNIQDIDHAILEPIGTISVIPKPERNFVTPKDLGLQINYQGLPTAVILEGKIQEQNLKLIGKNKEWLVDQLRKQKVDNIKEIFYATVIDNSGTIYVDNGYGINDNE